MIHTEQKHNIDGRSSTGDFWIHLIRDDPNFQTMLSGILSARTTRTPARITVTDESDSQIDTFIELSYAMTTS